MGIRHKPEQEQWLSKDLQQTFAQHADPTKAIGMEKYMKNHFVFFGIAAPERRQLQQTFFGRYKALDRQEKDQVLEDLWQTPQRECQYAACDWLRSEAKTLPQGYADNVEALVCRKSWWDTVDGLAGHVLGTYLLLYPKERDSRLERWMASGNLWLQRCAVLHQLTYRSKTDADLLYGLVLSLADSKAFFLQKAMGWALREYAKTDPNGVRTWLQGKKLPALTLREATKHLR
ncbi:MAG: DNA alkylation repair protein [Bacteroidetes bacterium]|nr:DNA alkylation repair protein [Bacteroidota bacterium]